MFRGGEVPFNPKTDVADYGNFKEGFCSMKLIQKSDIRVQDMFFLTIVLRKIKTRQTLKKALVVITVLRVRVPNWMKFWKGPNP